MIEIIPVSDPAHLNQAFAIRREVFVQEQHVPAEAERDEFENESHHFLALLDGQPVGAARWRRTSNGIKLERFAVKKTSRTKGVGKALLRAILDDIFSQQPEPIERIYLNAHVSAMPLYTSVGFVSTGPMFEECGIQHYKMVLPASAYPHT